MKTLQEDIIDKLKELCSFLDDHLEVDLSRDNWKIRKSLYNDLAILEDHLKRQEKQSQLNEQEAGNYGITDKIIEEAMNVNTPFFGNSGAKVPTVEQKPSESAEKWLFKTYPEVKKDWCQTGPDDNGVVEHIKAEAEVSDDIADINFIKWYSGMEESKIRNAFKRYKNENKIC